MLYRMAIAACKQDMDLKRAMLYLNEMKEKNIPEHLEIYHLLIRLCRHVKDLDTAELLIEQILTENKVQPTEETIATLVHTYTQVDMDRGMKYMLKGERLLKAVEKQMSDEERRKMDEFAAAMADQANPPKKKRNERLIY